MQPAASLTNWQPGTLVGERYEVVRRLTAGGMGEVYEGRDTKRDLPVALKRMVIESSGSVLERERRLNEASVRMHREAIHTSHLGHPGIVNVLDLTYDFDSTPVVVMELLHGITLQEHITYSPLPAHVAAHWMAQVLDALAVAHASGVVHRDLKPANLFLVEDPAMPQGVRVKILDFGVAKQVSTDEGDDEANTAVTMINVFLGSYQYAAPEQFDPTKGVSPRSDLYAVGVIFFRALTGRHPANTKTLNDLMLRTLFGNIERAVRPYRPDAPAWLDAVIQRALALRPDDRFHSAEEMRDALLEGERTGASVSSAPPPAVVSNVPPPKVSSAPPPSDNRAVSTQPPPARSSTLMRVALVVALLLALTGWAGWFHIALSRR